MIYTQVLKVDGGAVAPFGFLPKTDPAGSNRMQQGSPDRL